MLFQGGGWLRRAAAAVMPMDLPRRTEGLGTKTRGI
jgi:hypothetical protein